MCARYSLTIPTLQIESLFAVEIPDDLPPRFNIAPTQNILTIAETRSGRMAQMSQWGYVPVWAQRESNPRALINIRSETVSEKFRSAWEHGRYAIPADGFYEWRLEDDMPDEPRPAESLFDEVDDTARKSPKGPVKRPYRFTLGDEPFALAGIGGTWRKLDGSFVETCGVLTTASTGKMKAFHERTPCIIRLDDVGSWLDPEESPERLKALLLPIDDADLRFGRVNQRLNNARNDDADLLIA